MEEVFAGTDWMEMEILGWIHFMSRATLNCKVRHCRQVHTVGCDVPDFIFVIIFHLVS